MGKKSAYSGISAKDAAINSIDKFIQRNSRIASRQETLPGRRKDTNIPIHMWPLADQIAHYDSYTGDIKFNETYTSYSIWYNEVQRLSGVYHTTFLDLTSKLKTVMQSLYADKVTPKLAILELRKHGVY